MEQRTEFLPAQMSWPEWGPIFLDESVWRPVVERICWATGLDDVQTVEAGYPGTCAVFVVNGERIVKLYPPMLPVDAAKESRVYRLLSGRVELLPRLLGAGVYRDRIDWPYLVLAFCPGTPIRELHATLDDASKARIAQQLGATLRTVHTTPMHDAPPFESGVEPWATFVRRRQIDCVRELRAANFFGEPLLREIETFVAGATQELLAQMGAPVLLHADLTEDHLLLVRNEENVDKPAPHSGGDERALYQASALLDWADAEAGAPAYEWIPLWFGLCNRDPALFRAILYSYDPSLTLDRDFYREVLAYTFLHRFGPGIIEHVWRTDGCPAITTLDQLRHWLWPQSAALPL